MFAAERPLAENWPNEITAATMNKETAENRFMLNTMSQRADPVPD